MKFNRLEICGATVLAIGVILLIFTFINAWVFLQEPLSLVGSAEFTHAFGEALVPLIVTCIRIMYMGIMGWIGSLLTIRGLTLLNQSKTVVEPKIKIEPKKVEAAQKTSKETKKPPAPSQQTVKPAYNAKTEPQQKPETSEPEKSKQQPLEEEKKQTEEPKPQPPEAVVIPPTPQQVSSESAQQQ